MIVFLAVASGQIPQLFFALLLLRPHDLVVFLFVLLDCVEAYKLLLFESLLKLLLFPLLLLFNRSVFGIKLQVQSFFLLELHYLLVLFLHFSGSLSLPRSNFCYFSGHFLDPLFVLLLPLPFQKLVFFFLKLSNILLENPSFVLQLLLMFSLGLFYLLYSLNFLLGHF
jgi:hypothetical protein